MLRCLASSVLIITLLSSRCEAVFDSRNIARTNNHIVTIPGLSQLRDQYVDSSRFQFRKGGHGPQKVVGLFACASTASVPVDTEEAKVAKLRKIARSVDKVFESAITGFCGPWVIGFLFGVIGGLRSSGFSVAVKNAVGTGNSWGLLSASFCGVETLAREIRGTHDKWNNILGACSAGVVSNCALGPQAMATGCLNFAGMSYLLDLFMSRQKDPFEQYVKDPSKVDQSIEGSTIRNQPKDKVIQATEKEIQPKEKEIPN